MYGLTDLVFTWHDEPSKYPDDPDGHGEPHGESHVDGFSVVLPYAAGLEGQQDHNHNEKDDVEETEKLLLKLRGAGLHDGALALELCHLWGRGNQPLDSDHKLDENSEAEEEGLVGGG